MKKNRVHYTWNTKTQAKNCFNAVQVSYVPNQSLSVLLIGAIVALLSKLKLGGGH